jgi:acetyl esterase/lipase
MNKTLIQFIFLITFSTSVLAQQIIPLYEITVPGLKEGVNLEEKDVSDKPDGIQRLRNVSIPTLTVFKPKVKSSDAAVIICPGGGYQILAFDHEGLNVAKWFSSKGITAFVLKYRLPQVDMFTEPGIRPLQDAQQAIRMLRKNASKYGIDPKKIGIMGFSAGGHLAATASNHFNTQVGEIVDLNIDLRPSFSILIYPVVSFSDKYGHRGSRDNLLGKDADIKLIDKYSNEKQVSLQTPPAFLVHAFDDWVHVDNSIEYYKALKKHGIPSELHLYDRGGHGFSMKKDTKGPVSKWPERLEEWLKLNQWMK